MLCCEATTAQGLVLSSDAIQVHSHNSPWAEVITPISWESLTLLPPVHSS